MVFVEWRDSSMDENRWKFLHDFLKEKRKQITVKSVGWLVDETEEIYVLCHSWARERRRCNEQISGVIRIPKCSVISFRVLEPRARRSKKKVVK